MLRVFRGGKLKLEGRIECFLGHVNFEVDCN